MHLIFKIPTFKSANQAHEYLQGLIRIFTGPWEQRGSRQIQGWTESFVCHTPAYVVFILCAHISSHRECSRQSTSHPTFLHEQACILPKEFFSRVSSPLLLQILGQARSTCATDGEPPCSVGPAWLLEAYTLFSAVYTVILFVYLLLMGIFNNHYPSDLKLML